MTNPTPRRLATAILLTAIGANAEAPTAPPQPTQIRTTPATALDAVQDDIAGIEQRRGTLRTHLRALEQRLVMLERQIRGLDVDVIAGAHWPQPLLAAAIVTPPSMSALSLNIDVPEARPEKTDSAVAATPPATLATEMPAPAATPAIAERGPLDESLAMNDDALGEMRGGFVTPDGLQISFGIERAIFVNGELVTMTTLNLGNLGATITSQVQGEVPKAGDIIASTNATVGAATGTGAGTSANTTSSDSATGAAASTVVSTSATVNEIPVVTTASATGAAASSGNAVANSGSLQATTVADGMTVIQSGAGNVIASSLPSAAAIGTIVQNTLNDQKIQNITVVNASVNSMQVLQSMNLHAIISSAVADSVRR